MLTGYVYNIRLMDLKKNCCQRLRIAFLSECQTKLMSPKSQSSTVICILNKLNKQARNIIFGVKGLDKMWSGQCDCLFISKLKKMIYSFKNFDNTFFMLD